MTERSHTGVISDAILERCDCIVSGVSEILRHVDQRLVLIMTGKHEDTNRYNLGIDRGRQHYHHKDS